MSGQNQMVVETARRLEQQIASLSEVLGKVVAEGEALIQKGTSPQQLNLQDLRDWRARLDMFHQELAATVYFDHLQEFGPNRAETLHWIAQLLAADGPFNEGIAPRWSTVWQQEGASLNVDMELTAHRFLDESSGVVTQPTDQSRPIHA